MKISALIVDDEALARDEMKFLLGTIEDINIIGEAAGGEEAVLKVRELHPDLLFLDIQMPVMDGFGVIRTLLGTGDLPLVIFTTAYDQYAIKAFEVNAVDYLLKPIDHERLGRAVQRAKDTVPRKEEFIERVRKFAESIHAGTRFLPQIVLRNGEEVELIDIEKVALLRGKGSRITAHTADGNFLTNYSSLDELEVQVDPTMFIRLGSDYLVNLKRIGRIVPWSGGHYLLALDDAEGTEVKLSRSQATLLKNKVEGII